MNRTTNLTRKAKCTLLWLCAILTPLHSEGAGGGFEGLDLAVDAAQKTYSISVDGKRIVADGYAAAKSGERLLITTEAVSMEMAEQTVSDELGSGRRHTLTYLMPTGERLVQTFTFYDQLPGMVARLGVTDGTGATRSNYLAPVATETTASFLPADRQNRMLWVPWDNDGWVRYQSYYLHREMNSISATALFNADTRQGVVVGALDHDTWKSAIHVKATDYHSVDELRLISGYTDRYTRDTIDAQTMVPHGTVVADTVWSSRFFIGFFADWRDGMERYADVCTLIAPRRQWAAGTPYAWNTWGVMQEKVTYQGVQETMHFIHDQLMPHGFYDSEGRVVISLDAWVQFSDEQIRQFVDSCEQLGMIPGMYMCPFTDWGKYDRAITGTTKYTYKDLWLKHQGQYVKMTDAYALDPTHPGTKIALLNDLNRYRRLGIKFIKMDFMCHGAVEADSWYNPDVHTGLQAYNEGMAFIRSRCGDDVYINLSIAPIFPYQYAEGRRICCDAYSSIDNTQYVMNSTSFGWWLSRFYICDPDNMVLKSIYHGGQETEGENRARLTSGVCTGMFGNGDSYSDDVPMGYPAQSRERALLLLTNDNVNAIPRTTPTFRPVEGGEAAVDGAESLLMGENDRYLYLAVINYQPLMPLSGTALFTRLGIDVDQIVGIRELWTGTDIIFSATGFQYSVPAKDARIYRIEKRGQAEAIAPLRGESAAGSMRYFSLSGVPLSSPKKNAVNLVREIDGTVSKRWF